MNTPSTAVNTGSTTVEVTDLPDRITSSLATADTRVTQTVTMLANVHTARLARENRTVAALTSQYGASDPRVIAATATANATGATIARLSVVSRQVSIPTVNVAQAGWALHGTVITAALQPAARFTVFLVDANKAYLRQYGFAFTDDTGYFLINYGNAAQSAGDDPGSPAFIEVANTSANPVYLAADPFAPVVGAATYLTITLPADGQPIGDPPAEIRRIAMPET